MIAKAQAYNCLDEQYCIQKEDNWEDVISIFPIIPLEMPIEPLEENTYEVPTQQQVSIKTSVENETKLVPMTKEAKNNGSNEFTLTKEQADKMGLPFIAGKYIFINLSDGLVVKQEWLFVNDENANKLKELLGSDVKAGYYQKPITQTTQTQELKWYENKWVIVAGCFAVVSISHSLSENSGSLNGFLSGFSNKKKSKKSVKKQKKDKLK